MAIDSDAYLDEDNSAGKFFQIEVPAYVVTSGEGPNSYLRLGVPNPAEAVVEIPGEGSAAADTHADLGTDLALKAWIKGLDVKGKSADTEDGPYTLFEDDERDRGPHTHLSKEDRKSATDAFFQKLGWRDHTDGNRLTTTRGDKVEVIRGNYKLVVLGRQDTPGEAAGFDMSGGDTRGLSCVDAEVDCTEVTWDDGCWNVTEKVHAGKVYEYFLGKEKHEQVGKEGGSHDENPKIYETTWAQNIESRTVVEDAIAEVVMASNIAETTNAVTITGTTTATSIAEVTNAGVIQEMTNALVSIAEQVNAGSIEENVNCTGPINSMTVAGAINEQVNSLGPVTENVNAGAIVEMTNAGGILSMTTANQIAEITLTSGSKTDVFVGPTYADVKATMLAEILVGMKLEFALSLAVDIALSATLKMGTEEFHLSNDVEVSAADYTLDATGDVMITAEGVVCIGEVYEDGSIMWMAQAAIPT